MNLELFTNHVKVLKKEFTYLGIAHLENGFKYYFSTDIKHDRSLQEFITNIIEGIINNLDKKEIFSMVYDLREFINIGLENAYTIDNTRKYNIEQIIKLGVEAYLQEYHNKNYKKLLYNYILDAITDKAKTKQNLDLQNIYFHILSTDLSKMTDFNTYDDIECFINGIFEDCLISE